MLRACEPKVKTMVYMPIGYVGKRTCLPMWKGEAKFGQIMDGLLLRFVFFDYLVAGDYFR